MSEQNNKRQQSETDPNSESSSTGCLPNSECLKINQEAFGHIANLQMPIYRPARMPYVPNSPTQLHKGPIGLQQTGSPQCSKGYPSPYPSGFPAGCGPVPSASWPWAGRTESQSSEGNTPQFRHYANEASSSATMKLPSNYLGQKINNSHSYLRQGGLRMPTTSGGFDVTRAKIHENIDGNSAFTTVGNRPYTIDDPDIFSSAFKPPLNSSIFSPDFGNSPVGVRDSRPPSEYRDRHNSRMNQDERVGGNGNYFSGTEQPSHFPSFGSLYDSTVGHRTGERPSSGNALGPLQLGGASTILTPRGYTSILSQNSASVPTRMVTKPASQRGVKRRRGKVQDPLGSRGQIRSQNSCRGPSKVDLILGKLFPNQRTNSVAEMPRHTSPTTGEESTEASRQSFACTICQQTFPTSLGRFFHYREVHPKFLSDL